VTDLKPRHVYQYVDGRPHKVAAHREVEVLSHAYTKAVEWGLRDRRPFKGEVRFAGEKPRERYVTDDEVLACLSLPAMRRRGSVLAVQAYIQRKLLTGLRRGDLLRLRVFDCTSVGVLVRTHKTGKPVVYTWSDELRRAVDEAKAARPVDIAPWLFCTRRGECYVDEATGGAPGWKSLWQRFMARVLHETTVTGPFTEHDLRAKVGSNAESLERARALLAHADARTTQRVYRRKPERVEPAKRSGGGGSSS
jgi:integrase